MGRFVRRRVVSLSRKLVLNITPKKCQVDDLVRAKLPCGAAQATELIVIKLKYYRRRLLRLPEVRHRL